MFHPKRVFLVSFAVASLLCGSALANTAPVAPYPSPSPSPSDSPCFDFECKFEGGGGDKNGGWSQKCHAEGWFSTDQNGLAVLDDDGDGEFKIVCEDGDDDQDEQPIYDDCLRKFFDHDDRTLTLKGLHDRDPVILVQFGDRDGRDGRSFQSDLNFNLHGYNYDIPGQCKFFPDSSSRVKKKKPRLN